MSTVLCPYIDQWLLFFSRNVIQNLVLQFSDWLDGICVHSSLYSCQYLTHLELHVRDIFPPPPSFKGFLFLRSLYILMYDVSPSTAEKIVSYSPLLEKLTLVGIHDSEMTIRAPNLKYFVFYSSSSHLSLCTPLLEELMGDLCEAKHLSCHESSVFPHLRIIDSVTMAVIRLITCSPNLLRNGLLGKLLHQNLLLLYLSGTLSLPNLSYDKLKTLEKNSCLVLAIFFHITVKLSNGVFIIIKMCKKSSIPDLLSALPLGIIHIILSFIPLREAVRTSFLSRQWRYKWSSLPHLAFDNSSVINPQTEDENDANKLIYFISQALLLHEGPINKFQLFTPSLQSQWTDYWLLFLSRHHIRVLVFKFDAGFHQYLHSSLYSCQDLTHLELRFCDVAPPPPAFKGFLRLRSLRLCAVGLFSRTVESILANCPVLEELILDNLSLLDSSKTMSFSSGAESFRRSMVFPHLRIIKLSNVPFDDEDLTVSVIRLITGSPNLQKLEILGSPSWNGDATVYACASLWDTDSAPNFTYKSLKVIKMEGFGGVINEMKLIKFLVERSPVLEKMVYKPHQSLSDLELLKLSAQLVRYRRASANAEVVIVDDRV